MMRGLLVVGLAAAAGTSELAVTNLIALVLSIGTATAGVAAFYRARQDRPKIIAETATLTRDNLRVELEAAWAAVDRLRGRERELELELDEQRDRRHRLELRVTELEGIIRRHGLGDVGPAV